MNKRRVSVRNIRPQIGKVTGFTSAAPITRDEKKSDPHYGQSAHIRWRDAVLARAGHKCEGLNCQRVGVRLYADHIVERRDGGPDYLLENGMALCAVCHSTKTNAAKRKRGGFTP